MNLVATYIDLGKVAQYTFDWAANFSKVDGSLSLTPGKPVKPTCLAFLPALLIYEKATSLASDISIISPQRRTSTIKHRTSPKHPTAERHSL